MRRLYNKNQPKDDLPMEDRFNYKDLLKIDL